MNQIVIDASVAITWCFKDEMTKRSIKLLKDLESMQIIVPSIWYLEISNILLMAEKKGRISFANSIQFFNLLQDLDIEVDSETSDRSFSAIFMLAHAEKLTSYDASYLELAMRLNVELATKDQALINAGKRLGGKILVI